MIIGLQSVPWFWEHWDTLCSELSWLYAWIVQGQITVGEVPAPFTEHLHFLLVPRCLFCFCWELSFWPTHVRVSSAGYWRTAGCSYEQMLLVGKHSKLAWGFVRLMYTYYDKNFSSLDRFISFTYRRYDHGHSLINTNLSRYKPLFQRGL